MTSTGLVLCSVDGHSPWVVHETDQCDWAEFEPVKTQPLTMEMVPHYAYEIWELYSGGEAPTHGSKNEFIGAYERVGEVAAACLGEEFWGV